MLYLLPLTASHLLWLDSPLEVESVTSFEGIGHLSEDESSVQSPPYPPPYPPPHTESSERALVPYALMAQSAMHGRAGWAGAAARSHPSSGGQCQARPARLLRARLAALRSSALGAPH